MKKRQYLSMLLLTAILASCGEAVPAADTTASDAPGTTAAPVETELAPDLPDLDLKGETITILYRDAMKNEFWTEEQNGEIVNDAVYDKNVAVEDRFNCKLEYIANTDTNWNGGYQGVISKSVLAGDEAYNIVSGPSFHMPTLILENCLYNLNNLDHLDLSKPWWVQSLLETTAFGDKVYLISGDISLGMLKYIHLTYFNKRLANEYKMGNLYQTVLDGKWTVDKMEALTKNMYQDLNNNGAIDYNADAFGYAITNDTLWRAYIDALELKYFRIGKNGLPEFDFSDQRSFDAFDLFSRWIGPGSNGDIVMGTAWENDPTYKIFTDGRAAFVMGRLIDAETAYRDMKDDWGLLPIPKWDEKQKDYKVTINGSESTFGVPVNSSKTEYIGAIMEALAYESWKTVTPAYFESALKMKYNRDDTDESIQVINIIKEGAIFSPAVQLSKLMGTNPDYIVGQSARKGTSLATAFAEVKTQWETKLQDIIKTLS